MTLSNYTGNEDKSEKFDFDINFSIEPSTGKNWNAPLDAPMCPYKSSIPIEVLSFTLYATLSTNLPVLKITKSVISWRMVNQKIAL